jgi:Uma2 family endonuclease
MSASQKPRSADDQLWAVLCDLPSHLKGEIIDGELFVQPRPRLAHARVNTQLGRHLGVLDDDPNDPGGWWILVEPGIELPGAPEIAPDLGGWRRSTMPKPPPAGATISVVPDWVCEVLSPTNEKHDRTRKLPLYARDGVPWLWLVDPPKHRLEVYALKDAAWALQVTCSREMSVRLPPFEEIELPVAKLWL